MYDFFPYQIQPPGGLGGKRRDPTLHDVAAQPNLHRNHPRQEAARARRPEARVGGGHQG